MSALLAPVLGGVGVTVAAVFGPLVTTAAQNRRVARMNADLASNIELLKHLRETPDGWTEEIDLLETLTRHQLLAAAARQSRDLVKQRNWGSLGAVIIILSVTAPILWGLAVVDTWWSWTIFSVFLGLALILSGIGIYQTFNPPEDDPSTLAASEE
ncbi:hypothetical protein [Streptomyces sp. SID13726]|uniref:hypothetical protein n=1 Tax=Streptomyces sp. SID13726 TaxID=2706058 RepID=UPI0013B95377|nr:hypothetical protein [Streptomyces sp. SID13726]NEB01753.1 hypothetical protein [Streptomyces sp. SID13726]